MSHLKYKEVDGFSKVIFQFYFESNTYHIGQIWVVRKDKGKI